MADFGHDYRRCDDGDETICPMCQFKARLSTLFQRAGEGHERGWDDVAGGLVDRLFDAIWALHRTRRERFTDEHDMIANSWEAANKLVQVFIALEHLRRETIDDDTLDDDEDDGL
jgi:hypothetical protein